MIYLIGSLRNPVIPQIANTLREEGHEVFDDWYAAGHEADDMWRDYEKGRGRSFVNALQGLAAEHVFEFDLRHLKRAEIVVLILPAGKSGHLELGWALGQGKRGYILLDDPERWDFMYKFADGVFYNQEDLINACNLRSGTLPGSKLVGDGTEYPASGNARLGGVACRFCGCVPTYQYEVLSGCCPGCGMVRG